MSKERAWYSIRAQDGQVYHDHSECPDGNKISAAARRPGTGGRQQCDICFHLSQQEEGRPPGIVPPHKHL